MYAKNLRLNKGVDNVIQFQFLNQEQKPVDITDLEVSCRILSYDGNQILLRKALSPTLALNGLSELIVTSSELEDIDTQAGYYSLEINNGVYDLPVYVNSEAAARGVIDIVDSVLPSFVPATDVTIPSHIIPNNSVETYYSSVIYTSNNPVLSIQPYFTGYSGNVQVQGSTLPDNEWYDIGDAYSYLDVTQSDGYTVNGFHPFVRLKFVSTQGNVTQILAR